MRVRVVSEYAVPQQLQQATEAIAQLALHHAVTHLRHLTGHIYEKPAATSSQAKDYARAAQGHAEGAARELLAAKRAELQAAALLNGGKNPDPASAEVLKAQAAAKCAEQLKVRRAIDGVCYWLAAAASVPNAALNEAVYSFEYFA